MSRLRKLGPILLLCAFAVALAACSGSTSTSSNSTSTGGKQVNVAIKEWSVSASPASVAAGSVTFSAKNNGTMNHELVVFKTDLAEGALPLSGTAVDEMASSVTKKGEIAEFAAGTTGTVTLNLEQGKYVLICNVPGHYQQGIHMAFTVPAASTGGSSSGRY
jgi:uncharacterized cupredoxin-like copper-binding protein